MNDVEHDLRELLDRKASSVGTVAPKLPEHVRKRSRRRELGTVLVSGLTVLAVVVGSVAVLRAVDTGRNDNLIPVDDPWAGYDVFERTVLLGPFVVTSPSDFYLVDPRLDPRCIPDFGDASGCDVQEVFQLSNYDPGLATPACGAPIPRGGAVLSVRYIFPSNEGQYLGDPPFPQPLSEEVTDGLCGPGRYAQSQIDGIRIIAWMGIGDGVAADDLTTLERAYGRLEVAPQKDEPPAPAGDPDVASYVVAGGENAAGPWRLDARPSPPGALSSNVALTLLGAEGGSVVEGFGVPAVPIEQAGGDPTFGAVTKQAASVELRSDGAVEAARIVPLPPSLGSDFDLFFGSHEGDVIAEAVALDADGQTLGGSYVVPPLDVTTDGNLVVARLEAFGSTWELSAPRHGNSCSLRNTSYGVGGLGGTCEISTTTGDSPRGFAFVYGTLPPAAHTAQVVAVDGATYPCRVLTTGPSGRRYFVIALEGAGPGEFQLQRADGTVIRRLELSWADPTRS
jgi:hypothetical protein